jgi:SAM-dependent methyltransferase
MLFRRRSDKTRFFHRCSHSDKVWDELEKWYDGDLGRLIAEHEQLQLDQELGNLFGYHLLQVGCPGSQNLLRSSRVRHRMRMHINPTGESRQRSDKQFCATPAALPFLPDTLDVVVLSHILEFSDDPHGVLREVERTLIPEGHVVILGFNPISLWSFWRLLLGWKGAIPWCGHYLTITRLKDWLALLDFEVVQTRHYFYRPPFKHSRILQRLRFLERVGRRLWPILGGGYLMVARKRVVTLTPIRPRWKSRRRIAVDGLVEPMTPHEHRKGVKFESDR